MEAQRHMLLLSLELGARLDVLKKKGLRMRFEQAGGMDNRGEEHLGLIVISKGEPTMLVQMSSLEVIEVWAEGIGETKGRRSYEPQRVTTDFVMRTVGRFLRRCDSAQ